VIAGVEGALAPDHGGHPPRERELVLNNKLFVGSLAWETTDESLREAFEAHGDVTEAKVIRDRETGRSRGFGFVTFESPDSAASAVDAMNDTELDGRTIRVEFATERPRR
jgi:RNA recognition motif-containing protein